MLINASFKDVSKHSYPTVCTADNGKKSKSCGDLDLCWTTLDVELIQDYSCIHFIILDLSVFKLLYWQPTTDTQQTLRSTL